jgi:hypothetical protein
MALVVTPSPSGLVLGVGVGGRDAELIIKLQWGRAQEPDYFSRNCLGSPLCKSAGVVVYFPFLLDLYANYNPTAII